MTREIGPRPPGHLTDSHLPSENQSNYLIQPSLFLTASKEKFDSAGQLPGS